MKTILILILTLSTNLFAQDKYIMLKPLTWDELQLYQLDILKTADKLKLSSSCPSTLKELQNDSINSRVGIQFIHGTKYVWTEFENSDGLLCIVKQKNVRTLNNDKESFINPNDYRLLDLAQMRVLKSASLGGGDSEKERFRNKRIMEINSKNQAIQNKPYEKYGGMENLLKYMQQNPPIKKIAPNNSSYIDKFGSHSGTLSSPLLIFEVNYSQQQQNELLNSVKKNRKIIEVVKTSSVNTSSMLPVPSFKVYNNNYIPVRPYGAVGRSNSNYLGQSFSGSDLNGTKLRVLA